MCILLCISPLKRFRRSFQLQVTIQVSASCTNDKSNRPFSAVIGAKSLLSCFPLQRGSYWSLCKLSIDSVRGPGTPTGLSPVTRDLGLRPWSLVGRADTRRLALVSTRGQDPRQGEGPLIHCTRRPSGLIGPRGSGTLPTSLGYDCIRFPRLF